MVMLGDRSLPVGSRAMLNESALLHESKPLHELGAQVSLRSRGSSSRPGLGCLLEDHPERVARVYLREPRFVVRRRGMDMPPGAPALGSGRWRRATEFEAE
jgi:hypothetical protein